MWQLADGDGGRAGPVRTARAEPTNDISVCNAIVLPSQANAIRVSAHSEPKPQSRTLEATLRLIFEVDKNTPSP